MPAHGLQARAAGDRAQDRGDDDGVVGVPQNGDDVGDHVDRAGEIGQQQRQPHTDAARQRGIGRQTADQAERVGEQPQRLAYQPAAGPDDGQRDDESQPGDHHRGRETDEQVPSPRSGHTCPLSSRPGTVAPGPAVDTMNDNRSRLSD
ncbi:hypothetical protein Ssi03_15140 [Sphaerisporangium siamense]|uniref:Uncharacterized protein n=1 Tax=Sphaerisporangium siamense TaxID=795645 RepID=A0A7W7D9X4_9ACTN|nr:hypothetical protein [Sphaerisporangium siamense]GII83524.1 hypothetical protein Ssi03_15140 [Sphaerisporangium siamense]